MDATALDFQTKKAAQACARSHMQATSQHIEATVRGSSNTREFKYVTANKTRRNTVYVADVRVSGALYNKYFARCPITHQKQPTW